MKTLLDAGFEGSLLNLQTRYLRKLFTVYHPDLNLPDYAIAYQSGSIYMLLVCPSYTKKANPNRN